MSKKLVISVVLSFRCLFAGSLAVEIEGPPLELWDGETYLMAPLWSPDGKTIAVTSRDYRGIYLLSYPEGDLSLVSERPSSGLVVKWSPSGNRILSIVSRYEDKRRYNAVAVFDVLSGKMTLMTQFQTSPTGAPSWSKTGEYVILATPEEIRLLDSEGEVTTTAVSALAPESVVISHREEVIAFELPEKRKRSFKAVEGEKLNLTVSPDGEKVAFEILGGHLWVTDMDGSNAVDLGVGYRPSWGPGSDKVAYMITQDDGHRYLSSDVIVVNADGTGRTDLTRTDHIIEMNPSWSPDGKWIAYHTLAEGKIVVQEVR